MDLHRYPSPTFDDIKTRIAELRSLPGPEYVFLGVGSDEVIDLLMRICVAPRKEKILTTPPTYGMYAVCAQVNDVGVVKCPLELSGVQGEGGEHGRFSIRLIEIKKAIDADSSIKLLFLCSPGNPTGTLIPLQVIKELLEYDKFKGIIVVDEAYIDFGGEKASAAALTKEYANICVVQTLSKSFGLAAIRSVPSHDSTVHQYLRSITRLGIAIAHPALIQILMNTKAPYNISTPTASLALSALAPSAVTSMREKVSQLVASRGKLLEGLADLASFGLGRSIGGNDANFVVVPVLERNGSGQPDNGRAHAIYKTLAEQEGVVVRYRGSEAGCAGCLRITVGSEAENAAVLQKLRELLVKL
ncbi:hypothetical protein EUX98_g5737 [Antrodiella citrinella]|uniref:histidinol-phosphate transaminase n=1 Tax=Antrodiella citrinella TaxID=2447956 RepID=A0A4V3XIA7_9APHY|nr:hypothetical protein EUX98_g5737 [Antrodiella citrinella]